MVKRLKKEFGDSTTHYRTNCIIEKSEVNAGLNLLSDFNGISQHLQRLAGSLVSFMAKAFVPVPESPAAVIPSLDKMSTQTNLQQVLRACYWDTYRFKYQGKTVVNVRQFSVGVLTGTVPYDRDSIKISIEGLNILHFDSKIDLLVSAFTLRRLIYADSNYSLSGKPLSSTMLMKIPLVEASFLLDWGASNDYLFFLKSRKLQMEEALNFIAKSLVIQTRFHFPKVVSEVQPSLEYKSVEEMMTSSAVPIILYETNVYNELFNLPQLRHEYLLLHGIKPSNYNEEGSDADKAINKQKVAVFSNYMELLTYTLNQALNRKEENLVKFISQVGLALHTTSIRFIATNKNMAYSILKNVHAPPDTKDDNSVVVGIQSIIESITYSSTFVKKPLLRVQKIVTEADQGAGVKETTAPSMLVWTPDNGRGQLDCFMAGYLYRNYKLIKFDEAALLRYKKEVWMTSMENPEHFASFFSLKPQSDEPLNMVRLELFDHDKIYLEETNITTPFTDRASCFMSPRLLKLCTSELFNYAKTVRPKAPTYFGNPAKEHPVHGMNFDHHEVFFSTRVIIYELSKQRDLVQVTGHDLCKEELVQASFDHFVTLFDSRICIVYSLFKAISEMLEVNQDKNVNKLRIKSKKRKQTGDGVDRHVLKTEEEARWNEMESCKGNFQKRSLIEEKQCEIVKEKELHNTKTSYLYGIVIIKPQFNFNDYVNFNQTIFTSKEECFIYMQRETLMYDYFSMDPRYTVKTIFKDLELFNIDREHIATETDTKWIDNMENIDRTQFVSVLNSDLTIFTNVYYQQEEYLIDFAKPFIVDKEGLNTKLNQQKITHFWGGMPRNKYLTIDVKTFESGMDSVRYRNFNSLVAFIVELFVKNKKQDASANEKGQTVNYELKSKQKLNELKERGKENLSKHLDLQSRAKEAEFPMFHSRSSIFEFFLRKVNLKMIKNGEVHYILSIRDFCKRDDYETNGRVEQSYSVGKMSVCHLKTADGEKMELLRRITTESRLSSKKTS